MLRTVALNSTIFLVPCGLWVSLKTRSNNVTPAEMAPLEQQQVLGHSAPLVEASKLAQAKRSPLVQGEINGNHPWERWWGGGEDQRGEASVPQCDEDVETWYGIWEASLTLRSHGSGRHVIYLC